MTEGNDYIKVTIPKISIKYSLMLKRWCIFFYDNFYVGLENPMENDLHAQILPIDLSIVILLILALVLYVLVLAIFP